jgi:hypothetical protein
VVVFSSEQTNKFRTTSRKQRTSIPTRVFRCTYQKSVGVRLGSTASLELLRDTLQDTYSVAGEIKILSSVSFIIHCHSPSSLQINIFTFFRFSGDDMTHILFFGSNTNIKVGDSFSCVIEFFVNIFSRFANLASFLEDQVHHTAGSEVESLLAWIIWIMTPLSSWLQKCAV